MTIEEKIPEILKTTTKKLQWPLHYYATEEDLKDKWLFHATSGELNRKYPTPIFMEFVKNKHQSRLHGKPQGRYYLAWRA